MTAEPQYDAQLSFVTSSDQRAAVDLLAAEARISRAELLRQLVGLALPTYRRKIAQPTG